MNDEFIARIEQKKSEVEKNNTELAFNMRIARNSLDTLVRIVNMYADFIESNGTALDRKNGYLGIDFDSCLVEVPLGRGRVIVLCKDAMGVSNMLAIDIESIDSEVRRFRHSPKLLGLLLDGLKGARNFPRMIEDAFILQLERLIV